MKLQFVDETPSLALAEDLVTKNDSVEANSPESMKMLSDGIESAQKGDRAKARHLLLKVTETDPGSETAWLWLASISEYPEELLIFLNNVLEVNPNNERAIKWAAETKTLLAKTFVQRGIDAEKDEKREFARQCFLQAIVHDSKSELAWMWLASVADSDEEKVSHLRKVININPDNEKANASIARAQARIAKQLITTAKSAFYDGDRVEAERLVDECLGNDPKFEEALLLKSELAETVDEKIEYLEKVVAINPENQSAIALIETAKQDRIHSMLSSARSLIDAGQSEEAAELLDEILADSPESVDGWMLKAEISGSPDEKLELINKVLELDPEHEFAAQEADNLKLEKARALVAEANDLIEAGKDEDALRKVNEALEVAPEYDDALLAKCQLVDSSEEKSELLNLVLKNDPDNHAALDQLKELEKLALTMILAEAGELLASGDLDSANESLKKAQNIAPEDENVLLLEYELSSSPQKRRSILERVLEIAPENEKALEGMSKMDLEIADSLFAKASSAAAAGNRSEADKFLTETFEIAPDHENAWMLKALLCDSFEAKIGCFERVLVINPENAAAQANLQSLKTILENSAAEPIADSSQNDDPGSEFGGHDNADSVEPAAAEAVDAIASDFESAVQTDDPEEFDDHDIDVTEIAESEPNPGDEFVEYVSDEYVNGEETGYYDEDDDEPISMPQSIEEVLQQRATSEVQEEIEYTEADQDDSQPYDLHFDANEETSKADPALKTILVVDDSPTILKLIAGKLEKSGYNTVCAIDGMDAIKRLEDMVPDMVILDINMPNMDGYQVCRVIRENELLENTPVIMVSGKDGFYDEELGDMAGSTDFISKPFGPETLMKIVNEHLSE
ncbi:MAG: response regulator [Pyrinomonadaceae bacterium]